MKALLLALSLLAQDDDAKKKDAEAKERVDAFTKALGKCKKDDDLIAAIEELGKTQHARILEALKPWLGKGSADVRIATAREIGKYARNKGAAEALFAAGSATKEPEVAARMIRLIGDVGWRPIAKDLVKFFGHKSPDVAAAACDACGTLKSKATIAPLIDLVRQLEQIKEEQGAPDQPGPIPGPPNPGPAPKDDQKARKDKVLPAAIGALHDISGENKKTGQEWNDWWKKAQATWKEPDEK